MTPSCHWEVSIRFNFDETLGEHGKTNHMKLVSTVLAPGHLRDAVNNESLFETGTNAKSREGDFAQAVDSMVRPTGLEPVTF